MENTNQVSPFKNRRLLIVLALPVLAILWALFRPELLFVNRTVNESLPPAAAVAAEPKALLTGSFTALAHQTAGKAEVVEVGGKKFLRFTDFHTSNGPDVRVYLVAGADGKDNKTINAGNYLDLGTIKGNIGDQNYELPADVDLARYRSVSIWCKRFAVNFGAANLM
ncbi:MAG: DM13 domain-containing protein [Capsulimonadales bacterium]|nr:DM13 domain-containing protein [Capsulimonadales bacterium]